MEREAALQVLDEMTPVYRPLLDKLSPVQRKVLIGLARLVPPEGPTRISRTTRVEHRQTSMALTRLQARGLVERQGRGMWVIVDPWLRTYILARGRHRWKPPDAPIPEPAQTRITLTEQPHAAS